MTFSAIVERALRCAVEAHAGQKRKDSEGSPYIVHSIHVALTLVRWGAEAEAVAAGLLHDVVEDCAEKGWSRERMEEEFGERVAGIVAEVTDSGVQRIEGGRLIPVKTLEKRCLPDD